MYGDQYSSGNKMLLVTVNSTGFLFGDAVYNLDVVISQRILCYAFRKIKLYMRTVRGSNKHNFHCILDEINIIQEFFYNVINEIS